MQKLRGHMFNSTREDTGSKFAGPTGRQVTCIYSQAIHDADCSRSRFTPVAIDSHASLPIAPDSSRFKRKPKDGSKHCVGLVYRNLSGHMVYSRKPHGF